MRLNVTNKKSLRFFRAIRLSKTWIVTKTIIIMLLATITMASAKSYSQNLTLDIKNARMELVFNKIEKLSDYSFIYEKNLLRKIGKVDVAVYNKSIDDAMSEILKGQPLEYVISNKFIVISPKAVQIKSTFLSNPIIQLIAITGIVKDANGATISGVTVLNKTTNKKVITDALGAFKIDASTGDILVFSFVGYIKQSIIVDTKTELPITLVETQNELNQVVVTAMGIKRSSKSLTYNVQEIKGEELLRNRDANFVNSLTGKVAGVTINASSAGIGGATRVIMRGSKSIAGNNNAMYVIDGIPVSNSTNANGGIAGQMGDIFSANTSSEIISLLNADDIESISALTGAAAAALYGSQGQNGVILITTKKGKSDKTQLSLSNNTSFFSPLVMPKFQHTYGQSEPGSYYSWGPKLNTPSAYKPKDFFQTGNNSTTGLTFSTGTEKNQTFLSGSMVRANGIIPNNELKRYNFSIRNSSQFLNDKLSLDVNAMYVSQTEQNMVAQGLYHNPLVPIYLFPPGGDINTFKTFERYDATRLFPVQFWPYIGDQFRTENPYWIINRESSVNSTRKLLLSASLKYTVNNWLNITTRGRLDRTDILGNQQRYASTDLLFSSPGGSFNVGQGTTEVLYGDIIANVNKKFGDYTITGNVGGSRSDFTSQGLGAGGGIEAGSPPNIFTTNNVSGDKGTGAGSGSAGQPSRTSNQSIFAMAGISYKNMLFLEGSYRYEWYSQLYFNPQSQLYLTYPSIGASAVLTDLFNLRSDAVSFIKIRGNYAEVGNPPRIYDGGPQVFSLSVGTINQDVTYHLPLFPERTKAWEVGANLKFLRNKISLDVTLYNTNTIDQIFTVNQSASSGGNGRFLINAGKINNKGIEATLGYNGKLGSVQWESNTTFTLNQNTVKKLYSTTGEDGNLIFRDSINIAGAGSYKQMLVLGGNMSAIYTTSKLQQDQNGYIYLNPRVSVDNKNSMFVGNADPKYTIGFNNNFSYKNINLSFLVLARVGGVGVSATQAMMDAYGVSQTTAQAREKGSITINSSPYTDVQQYYTSMGSGLNGVLGHYVYSATNVRLRELSLGYTIPGKFFNNVIQSLKLAAIANNVFMFYNKAPFDPESTASSGTFYQGIDYFRQPSLRSFGFSINARF
jgi:TonB-linked SusC/RagA family outer membrane protein